VLRRGLLLDVLCLEWRSATCLRVGHDCESCKSAEVTEMQFGRDCKSSPYSITERRVPELIPVLGCCQPAGDVSHKPGGRLPLLSAMPAAALATLKMAATKFAAW